MVRPLRSESWQDVFQRWMEPFLAALSHKAQRRWAPVYLQGLLGPGERKSVEPIASRVAPGDVQQLHHFVSTSPWDTAPLEAVLVEKAQQMVGSPRAVLIIDDTAIVKQGKHSAGVARQYCGELGKRANCQVLVSLTLLRGEVPVPVALRLFLPEAWAEDFERRARAGVPAEIGFRTKWQIALDELGRVCSQGAQFGCILADAGYGAASEFRAGLSERGLLWAVGVLPTQSVYSAEVELHMAEKKPTGRPPKHPIPSEKPRSAQEVIEALPAKRWREITWRRGTKGPLTAKFVAVRVRPADGPWMSRNGRLPGEQVWLVCEKRATGEIKYYLANHSARTSLHTLARLIKSRWSCEQGHQQMKEELGLDHYEGRSWTGLHHHALLSMIALSFLQYLRLGGKRPRKRLPRTGLPPRPTLPEVRRSVVARFSAVFIACPHCRQPITWTRHE